jgi:hypothetical protein
MADGFLFQREKLDKEQLVKATAYSIWSSKTNWEHVVYYPEYGIGLENISEDPVVKYPFGFIETGVIDCGPNVYEYGRLIFEQDIFFGYSSITWYISTSRDLITWTPWYKQTLIDVPVSQYVKFKFELTLSLEE